MEISFNEFCEKAKRGNLIPMFRKLSVDLDTPLSAFLKMASTPFSFLFESVEGGERWGRFSFLGANPLKVFRSTQEKWEVLELGQKGDYQAVQEGKGSLLIALQEEMKKYQLVSNPDLPRLCGGLIGFLGYDQIRFFEDLPDRDLPRIDFPDAFFGLYHELVIFDNLRHTAFIVVNAFLERNRSLRQTFEQTRKKLDGLVARFQRHLSRVQTQIRKSKAPLVWKSTMTRRHYNQAVLKAKEYIRAGDIFQVVLSDRWTARGKVDPFSLYRVLRELNPSPYLFYLRMGKYSLVGSSPELLVRLEKGKVTLRPIAGTRPRGKSQPEDQRLEQEMKNDPKERAEHLMLVDLGRNDVGRVCKPGTVTVSEFMKVERYSHVMHLVSNVEGEIRKGHTAFDLIRACFPAGTLSGAPKIRAMEIIEELEEARRGPYGGSVGYLDFAGNTEMAITIRSIAMNGKELFVQSGGGIVQDSSPDAEFKERENKARAVMEGVARLCS